MHHERRLLLEKKNIQNSKYGAGIEAQVRAPA
jgi:hypothetical protein